MPGAPGRRRRPRVAWQAHIQGRARRRRGYIRRIYASRPLPSPSATMPKPTLLQSILGRPSQTYHHPAQRDYHSTREELFKLAHATKFIPGQFDDSGIDSSTPGNSDSEAYSPSMSQDRPLQRSQRPTSSGSRSTTADTVPGETSTHRPRPSSVSISIPALPY